MRVKKELFVAVHCNRGVYTILLNYCITLRFRNKNYIIFDLDVHPEKVNNLPNKFSKKTIALFIHNYIVTHGYWRLWIDWFMHLGHAPHLIGEQVVYVDVDKYFHETENAINIYIDRYDFNSNFK